ncbi:MAG: hypothetical protein QOD42_3225 [Sphingomonadales bacterium]|jgi:hypothetical protein|nr:hypothetical protein [Sphingomonadales bacterium]
MRMILATASLALLAACGGGASNNSAGNSAANGAAPAAEGANTAAPVAAASPARENEIRECINDIRTELPAGSDLNAFCGCAVDKMTTGLRERPAMEQCAAEMGIRPNN